MSSTLTEQTTNRLFPVFLKLETLHTLLVGGGTVGLEKLNALLANSPDAFVTVIDPHPLPGVAALAVKHPGVHIQLRNFEETDLQGHDIVIVAADDKALSGSIKTLANGLNILVNVADTPDLCDFYLASVVQKGNLKVAISTNGKSPTMAKRLREILGEAIPMEINESLDNLGTIRSNLNGNFAAKVRKLNEITSVLAEGKNEIALRKISLQQIMIGILAALSLMLVGHILLSFVPLKAMGQTASSLINSLDITFLYFVLGGFCAQVVDGALGMAYGVSATTFLLTMGVPPAAASGSVHASEIFTSGVSGLMHLKFGNVASSLFKKLVLPGVVGAIVGAYILSSLENYNSYIKPVIAAYTLFLGVKILLKALAKRKVNKKFRAVRPLAFIGAFLDSIGGGGWGPIVTSTLISRGGHPRYTIGSVNLAEFFITVASSITFISMIGLSHWQVIAGLILGGMIAAPFGAMLTKRLNVKTVMILVAIIVMVTSLRNIYSIIF
ncbi:hypothetical protein SAMN05216436_10531 [bacterium A37T11]|nr:hypothetical protein SAMN05216436_10531 [bacterium A37T11]